MLALSRPKTAPLAPSWSLDEPGEPARPRPRRRCRRRIATTSLGCGNDEPPCYAQAGREREEAEPARRAHPADEGEKQGDAYTIWGITHDLHSRVHVDDVLGKKVSIVGYIVKTNFDAAPKCAIHKTGKGDPPECKSPVPTFSIADDKGDTKEAIDVMGWASNYAQMYIAHRSPRQGSQVARSPRSSSRTSSGVPTCRTRSPTQGAKVKVTGTYGVTFTRATELVQRPIPSTAS